MMQTIIIDDEPKAIELLNGYVEKVPFLECVATFRNPLKALDFLSKSKIDLILLDINMPQLSGISFLETLIDKPRIILTTAYAEYAVKSYEFAVDDYLLKPISFERFLKAVNRVNSIHQYSPPTHEFLLLKSGYQIQKVKVSEIVYLEKDGNYMIYHFPDKKILVRENVQQAMEKLPEYFIQTHKSYIVPLTRIEVVEAGQVKIGAAWIPLGASFKKEFNRKLNNYPNQGSTL